MKVFEELGMQVRCKPACGGCKPGAKITFGLCKSGAGVRIDHVLGCKLSADAENDILPPASYVQSCTENPFVVQVGCR